MRELHVRERGRRARVRRVLSHARRADGCRCRRASRTVSLINSRFYVVSESTDLKKLI